MNKIIALVMLLSLSAGTFAQDTNYVQPSEEVKKEKEPKTKKPLKEKMYLGGTLGLSFGTTTSILIEPMLGFKMTPKLSMGIGVGYRYGKNNNANFEYSNYLARVFARYIVIPRLYAHVEYMVESYDSIFLFDSQGLYNDSRTIVPFLFVGGGFRYPGPKGSFIIQVLFNVLQDNPNSSEVYPAGQPYISLGWIGGF